MSTGDPTISLGLPKMIYGHPKLFVDEPEMSGGVLNMAPGVPEFFGGEPIMFFGDPNIVNYGRNALVLTKVKKSHLPRDVDLLGKLEGMSTSANRWSHMRNKENAAVTNPRSSVFQVARLGSRDISNGERKPQNPRHFENIC